MTFEELSELRSKIHTSKEELKEMYKTMTQQDIADNLGYNQGHIGWLFKKYGIEARDRSSFHPRICSKETRKKMSNKAKGNTHWKFGGKFPNSEEKKMIHFFKKWSFPFKYVGDGSYLVGGKNPDFIDEEKKLAVEFYGELWHDLDDEPKRVNFFKECGWNTLIVWGREVGTYIRDDKTYRWERVLYDKILRWMADLG